MTLALTSKTRYCWAIGIRPFVSLLLLLGSLGPSISAQDALESHAGCRVEPIKYRGWDAQQISNPWLRLTIVPQNGGRLMQVNFAGHDYLFVNPKFAGAYFPPNPARWFNYGGDKIWLLPEGNNDEQHWPGNSDLLDDGAFSFSKLSEGKRCEIELTRPPDPQTGVQISRRIEVGNDSSRIHFVASMKNISGHTVEWSMQSVSQYDTSAVSGSGFNHNFWTFTPANSSSSYLNRYHVRFGPAENSSVAVRDDGLFTVHYVHMAAELWLDSTAGWVAVVDGDTSYAMLELFQYEPSKPYPGKASVIFWTNGPEMRLGDDGTATLSSDSDAGPYYLEAELNSPMCRLRPGESCTLETEWFPTRAGAQLRAVTDAGVIERPLACSRTADGKLKISGAFGVFFAGRLVAKFYDKHGSLLQTQPLASVKPSEPVSLSSEVTISGQPQRLSLHLEDETGLDRGALGETPITPGEGVR